VVHRVELPPWEELREVPLARRGAYDRTASRVCAGVVPLSRNPLAPARGARIVKRRASPPCNGGLPEGGLKPSKTMISVWVVSQQRMCGLDGPGELRGSEREGQGLVLADLRCVSVGFVLARTAECGVGYRRDDWAEDER
jgi:hypothetical protein